MKRFYTFSFLIFVSVSGLAINEIRDEQKARETDSEEVQELAKAQWRLFGFSEHVLNRTMEFLGVEEKILLSFVAAILKEEENQYKKIPDVEITYHTLVKLAKKAPNVNEAISPIVRATLLAIYNPKIRLDPNFRHGFFAATAERQAFIEVLFEINGAGLHISPESEKSQP